MIKRKIPTGFIISILLLSAVLGAQLITPTTAFRSYITQANPSAHAPEAVFTYSPPLVNEPINFNATASQPGFNGTHSIPIANYTWNFGDGTNMTIPAPNRPTVITTHTYTATGTYLVSLTVTCKDDPILIAESLTNDTTTANVTIKEYTMVYVSPSTIAKTVNETFTVELRIENVIDLYCWSGGVTWDPAALECLSFTEGSFLKTRGNTLPAYGYINNTAGEIHPAYAYTLTVDPEEGGASGNGILAYMTFRAKATGTFNVHPSDITLFNSEAAPLFEDEDAMPPPKVGIMDVFTVFSEGKDYSIVTVHNLTGLMTLQDRFRISDYAFNPADREISFNIIGAPGPNGDAGFCNVIISKGLLDADRWHIFLDGKEIAYAKSENSTHNSIYFTYTLSTLTRKVQIRVYPDVAVMSVVPSETSILVGEPVDIVVVAENPGSGTQTFTVTAYYDNNTIGTQTITNLVSGGSKTLTFKWNTTGVAAGVYTIKAEASTVPGEIITEDNTLTCTVAIKHGSALTISADPVRIPFGFSTTINGSLSPVLEGANVTIWYRPVGRTWMNLTTVKTNSNGEYSYVWTPSEPRTYEVRASWEGDANTLGAESTTKVITAFSPDVAVMSVVPSETSILIGETVNITVVAENTGSETQTFTVTAYYDNNTIGTETITNLVSGASKALTFKWNTAGVAPGVYTIKAEASTVPGEIIIEDNTLTDGTVSLIFPDLESPVADAGNDQTVVAGTSVSFDASGSSDNVAIVSYAWNFMDVTLQRLTGVTPTYTFATPGIYQVTLNVTDAAGNSNTDRVTVNVLSVIKVPEDYKTIQAAINAANPGDTILVASGTYYEHVVVNKTVSLVGENRDTTIIDGNGTGIVVYITANDVSITGFTIRSGGTNLSEGWKGLFGDNYGIRLYNSRRTVIEHNRIWNNRRGIVIEGSGGNVLIDNIIGCSQYGIEIYSSSGNVIKGNIINYNIFYGINLLSSDGNTIIENIISYQNCPSINGIGIQLDSYSDNNAIFHNNFINNTIQAVDSGANTWDNGYPSGGNYWSHYNGTDLYRGPYQNETGSDGIGDTPLIIDPNSQDRYPLITPWSPDVAVMSVVPSKTSILIGEPVNITVIAKNMGSGTQTFTVTVYYKNNSIGTETITNLVSGASKALTFTWYTAGAAPGVYTIKAVASCVLGETDTINNIYTDGTVTTRYSSILRIFAYPVRIPLGSSININGSLSPVLEGADVTIWYRPARGTWMTLTTVKTNSNGEYSYMWTPMEPRTYEVRASWEGDANTLGAESPTKVITASYPDVAITSVVPSETSIIIGETVDITVVAENPGFGTQTFTVTVYYDNNTIGTQTITNLDSGTFKTITFTWNTTGVILGVYTLKAEASTVPGENDTLDNIYIDSTVSIIDITPPVADAGLDQTVDEDTLVTLDGSNSWDNVGIANYTWNFGDGNVTTVTSPTITHVYNEPGTYTVTLTVKDAAGNSNTDTITITVKDITPPIANAGLDQTVDEDTLVTLDGSNSWDNVGIANYTWDFGDGNITTVTSPTITHTYMEPGTYTVTLTVKDTAGNSDTDTVTITVKDVTNPVADAGSDQTVDEDTLVTLDGSNSWDNVAIVSYAWNFMDVTLQTLQGVTPTYTFATPGVYQVTLNVTDVAGNWATGSVTVTVLDVTNPVADAGSDQTVNEDTLATLDGSGSWDNLGIANYTWNFGDGNIETVTNPMINHIYTEPGIYTVTLTVKDAAGNSDTDTVTITVKDVTNPVADAGSDQRVLVGEIVNFNATGSTDNVGIVNYTWDFGDGNVTTVTSPTITHTYMEPGIYTVTLTVKDTAGNSDTDTVTITVEAITVFPWWTVSVVVTAGVVAAAAFYLLWRRGRRSRRGAVSAMSFFSF